MSARVHTNPSNRAKSRETLEKKVVFKSVLDSPFRVPWYLLNCLASPQLTVVRPSIPLNLQNTALACTISLLDGVSEYHSVRGQENRKRKRLLKETQNKKRKVDVDVTAGDNDVVLPDSGAPSEETPPSIPPEVLSHLVVGINEVTRRLDAQILSSRKTASVNPDPASEPAPTPAPIKVIVVCRADVDPQILIDHLPHEVAAFNSSKPSEPIKIIPLPKGAEFTLAKAMGLRRVAVIAMDVRLTELSLI
jgi:ribonuclease P/MRP protein subunit POP3